MKIDRVELTYRRWQPPPSPDETAGLRPIDRISLIKRIATRLRQHTPTQYVDGFICAAPSYTNKQLRRIAAVHGVDPGQGPDPLSLDHPDIPPSQKDWRR